MKRIVFLITALCTLAIFPVFAQTGTEDPPILGPAAGKADFPALLKKIDESARFDDGDFSGLFTMVTEKPGKEKEQSQIRMFRRDSKKLFLILVLMPEADKGTGYLQEGDNLWFYDPVSRKFNHTSVKEVIAGSKAQSTDFDRDDTVDDYYIEHVDEGNLGAFPIWILSLKARHREVAYDRLRFYVRKDIPLILKQEELSLNGRVMRTILYPRYAEVSQGKFFPSQMLIIDEVNKGEKTQINMSELSTAKLPDRLFTKSFLEDAR